MKRKPKLTKKKYALIKTIGGIVHSIASCDSCEWEAQTKNACGLAAIHSIATGHQTRGETGMVFGFKGEK